MSEFTAAYHSSLKEGDYAEYGGTPIEPMGHVKYVGITSLSIHVELEDGTLIRVTNPTTFTDGLKVEVRKKYVDSGGSEETDVS